jgi:hypothetical protein
MLEDSFQSKGNYIEVNVLLNWKIGDKKWMVSQERFEY